MQNRVPASQQVNQFNSALSAAFVRRDDAKSAVESAEKEIVALRNVLAGVGLGQQLQQEINAESAKAEKASQVPPPAQ